MNSGEEYLDNLLKSMMKGESTADAVLDALEAALDIDKVALDKIKTEWNKYQ